MNTYNHQLWPHYTILRIKQSVIQYNEIDQMFSIRRNILQMYWCVSVLVSSYKTDKNHQYLFATLHRFKQSVNSIKNERQLTVEPPVKDCTNFNTKAIVNVLLCKLWISFAITGNTYIINLHCTKQRRHTKYLSWDLVHKNILLIICRVYVAMITDR